MPPHWKEQPVTGLFLPYRSLSRLVAAGYKTVGEVADAAPETLATIEGLGVTSISQIRRAVKDARNDYIRALRAEGLTSDQIGEVVGLTGARVRIILDGQKRSKKTNEK